MTADAFPEFEFTGFIGVLQGDDPASQPVARTIDASAINTMLDQMYRGPMLGFPAFSWWRKPQRRLNLFRARGEVARQVERSKWQEAGRSAWVESVRAKLQSAVYATGNGWSWTWDAPGVYGRPDLPPGAMTRDLATPPLWAVGDDGPAFDDLRREASIRLLTDHLIAIEPLELDLVYGRDHPDRPAPMTREQARAKAIDFLDRHA